MCEDEFRFLQVLCPLQIELRDFCRHTCPLDAEIADGSGDALIRGTHSSQIRLCDLHGRFRAANADLVRISLFSPQGLLQKRLVVRDMESKPVDVVGAEQVRNPFIRFHSTAQIQSGKFQMCSRQANVNTLITSGLRCRRFSVLSLGLCSPQRRGDCSASQCQGEKWGQSEHDTFLFRGKRVT